LDSSLTSRGDFSVSRWLPRYSGFFLFSLIEALSSRDETASCMDDRGKRDIECNVHFITITSRIIIVREQSETKRSSKLGILGANVCSARCRSDRVPINALHGIRCIPRYMHVHANVIDMHDVQTLTAIIIYTRPLVERQVEKAVA